MPDPNQTLPDSLMEEFAEEASRRVLDGREDVGKFDRDIIAASTRPRDKYVSLPPDLMALIDVEAEARVLGRRKLVEMVLRQWLKDIEGI